LNAMSKRQPTTSEMQEDASENPSVYDFLYNDSRRIGSYLSQFGVGHLQQLTQTKEAERGSKKGSETEGKLGVPGLGGGTHKQTQQTSLAAAESSVRVYDPLWTNARAFLNHLSENSLIQRNIDEANIGQFVLATGYLGIQDLAMFKDAWKLQSIQRKVKAGVGDGKKIANMTAAQKAEAREEQENRDLFLDMLQIMPHSVHARMITQGDDAKLIWCTLNQDYLVVPASDIVLTYGEIMSGEWSIIGILSAHPEYLTPDLVQEFDDKDFGLMHSIIGQLTKIMAPIVRVTLGRPAAAHAITPLLIFREVS
jgi:hypothetical protein